MNFHRWIHEWISTSSRHRVRISVPLLDKICCNPVKRSIVVASLRSALVCDACEGRMKGRLVTADLFGSSSSLTGRQTPGVASVFRGGVVTRSPPAGTVDARIPRDLFHSQICPSFSNTFHKKYGLGHTRPLTTHSCRGRSGTPERIRLRSICLSHFEKRLVAAHCRSKPWWKQVLFQQVNEEDSGYVPVDDVDNGASKLGVGEFAEYDSFKIENMDEDDVDNMLSDDRQYFSWQQKRKAIDELREYQETGLDPDSRDWEDWLDDSWGDYSQYLGSKDGGWYIEQSEWEKGGIPRDPPKKPERGMNRTIKELLLRIFETQEEVENDLNFEEKVFRFTSRSTATFVTILVLVPWVADFLVHDFVVVPFLRRWVEEVPLAAKILDVKESQKLHMIRRLKLERQRVRFEAEIGKAPPLSDGELNDHILEEALELREDLREENRQAFANIWSDAVAGFSVLLLLVFNPRKVAIMQMTGDRLFTNISDTGKAFIIILCTDIFLGYHSESGWETVIEILLDHYGLEVSQGSIYIFVAIVPVTIDACFKLWVFRYLTRLSPSAAATFREMKRH